MTQFSSFLWPRNIPFYVCNSYLCSSIGKILFPLWHLSKIYLWFFIIRILYIYKFCILMFILPGVLWASWMCSLGSVFICKKLFQILPSLLPLFFPPSLSLSLLPSLLPLSYLLSFCYSHYVLVSLFVVVLQYLDTFFYLFQPLFYLIFSFRSFYPHTLKHRFFPWSYPGS